MTERERIVDMLHGRRAGPLPWATRLDIWYTSRQRTGTLPPEFVDMDLAAIHRQLRVGQQKYARLINSRLHGVRVTVEFNGRLVRDEVDPLISFPVVREYLLLDQAGQTRITYETPAGKASMCYHMNEEMIRDAAVAYMVEHLIKDDEDLRVVKWILNHLEIEPTDEFQASQELIGDHSFCIGFVDRVPFQRIMLDFMGEEPTVYFMHDNPSDFRYLLDILTEQASQMIELALRSPALLIECGDNFEGSITSPRLFQQYCMPFLQETADRLHRRGRFLASHMDGNMKPLLYLIPESGVDVVESFSPSPLTQLTFEDAWRAWRDRVLIWGGIPSPIFESHYPEGEFRAWVEEMLRLIGDDGKIILGIGDQAMGPTLIERVEAVSQMLGR